MADGSPPSAAHRTLEAQLNAVRFQSAVEEGRWKVLLLDWPYLFVHVVGRDPASGKEYGHDFRLECEGFPMPGPFVERWLFAENETHGNRPPPPGSGSPGFVEAMKDWDEIPGRHGGIYRAWSRGGAGHNNWIDKRPDEAWDRSREITFIMEQLYALMAEQAVWLATRA